MLELAIGALVNEPCPFVDLGAFGEADHVSYFDTDCYARGSGGDYAPHCHQCITEYLEEAVQSDGSAVVGGVGR